MGYAHHIGVDENGLGARLGPLIVTAVMARVGPKGSRWWEQALPDELAPDLDDSKRLVSHADVRLAEAWTRALVSLNATSPSELFRRISLEGEHELTQPCPARVRRQCWGVEGEAFRASRAVLDRISGHVQRLRANDLDVCDVRTSVICVRRLNQARRSGHSRFSMDLFAMEKLVLALRETAGSEVRAVCGKVGGIRDYAKFFGPLGGRLHVALERSPQRSAYRFPGLGELCFVRDVDAADPLVMLASLVGKYVRELLMARIARHHADSWDESALPSGYHDPRTARFVSATRLARRRSRVPRDCFERDAGE
jgi:ribonuclease HII